MGKCGKSRCKICSLLVKEGNEFDDGKGNTRKYYVNFDCDSKGTCCLPFEMSKSVLNNTLVAQSHRSEYSLTTITV